MGTVRCDTEDDLTETIQQFDIGDYEDFEVMNDEELDAAILDSGPKFDIDLQIDLDAKLDFNPTYAVGRSGHTSATF